MNEVKAYDQFSEQIEELTEICNFLPDVSTDDGYQKSKRVSLDVGKILTAIEAKRKDLKSDSLAYGRKIDAEAKEIVGKLEKIQGPHKGAYKGLDNAKKEREAARKAKLEERIADMRDLPEAMRDSCSDEVKMAHRELESNTCEDFYEFTMDALKARDSSLKSLSDMFLRKLKEEQDAAELARLQEEVRVRQVSDEATAIREKAEKDARTVVESELEGMKEELAASKQEVLRSKDVSDLAGDCDDVPPLVTFDPTVEYKREVNQNAMQAICSIGGTSKETARAVITAIAKGSIPHITINY